MTNDEDKLLNFASNLRSDVKNINLKLRDQALLIESIGSTSNGNMKMMEESNRQFSLVIKKINKDPRNLIIFILLLICIIMIYIVILQIPYQLSSYLLLYWISINNKDTFLCYQLLLINTLIVPLGTHQLFLSKSEFN